MSKSEYENFIKTGEIPRTNVLRNGKGKEGYIKLEDIGDFYVESDVPSNTISKGETDGWGIINGPGSLLDRLNAKKGLPRITEMPNATNITIGGHK